MFSDFNHFLAFKSFHFSLSSCSQSQPVCMHAKTLSRSSIDLKMAFSLLPTAALTAPAVSGVDWWSSALRLLQAVGFGFWFAGLLGPANTRAGLFSSTVSWLCFSVILTLPHNEVVSCAPLRLPLRCFSLDWRFLFHTLLLFFCFDSSWCTTPRLAFSSFFLKQTFGWDCFNPPSQAV